MGTSSSDMGRADVRQDTETSEGGTGHTIPCHRLGVRTEDIRDLKAERRRVAIQSGLLFIATFIIGAFAGFVFSKSPLGATYPYSVGIGLAAAGPRIHHRRAAAAVTGAFIGFVLGILYAVLSADGTTSATGEPGDAMEYGVYMRET